MPDPTRRINLDYAGGTPLLPEVQQVMAPWLDRVGNPSSLHAAGREAKRALEWARQQTAQLIGAAPDEICFTSCGSESNAWAIKGLLQANARQGRHLIVSAIEHPSVLLTARRLERDGWDVAYLPVTPEGLVEPSTLKDALKPETALVSIMHANGEIGTIQPITELAAIAREAGALFHTDAVASVGHWPVTARAWRVDALSLAANQFYGPAGAAALYVREGARILPLIDGGGQETGARSGTEALLPLIGMGCAAELARERLSERIAQTNRLRDRLKDGIMGRAESLRLNGSWTARLPHNLHVCVSGVSSESLVLGLDQAGIAAGIGSACNSKAMRPSHVLKAIGLTEAQAQGALLLTVGEPTTEAEIDQALERLPDVVAKLRAVTALTMARR